MTDTRFSYAGLRAAVERDASPAKAGLARSLARSGVAKAFAGLTIEQMLASMTDEQRTGLAAKLKVSVPTAKSSAAPVRNTSTNKADLERERAAGYAQGRAEMRAAIKQVLASPDSRGVEREAMTALAAGAYPDKLLADLADRNILAANMRARYAKPAAEVSANSSPMSAQEPGSLAAAMRARFEGGAA